MIDIVSYLPSKRKQTSSGWISFNAPCCVHRGESQDKKSRGGLKSSSEGWSFHCFNCGYKASFILGRSLSFKARNFLKWLNVPQEQIEIINLESLRHKTIHGIISDIKTEKKIKIEFEERQLPADLDIITQEHTQQYEYLKNRQIPLNYPFMTNINSIRPGIVIPFTHNNTIVGNCTRFLDARTPKYINDMQQGYVFGTDLQSKDWDFCIVVEGVFDALAINGLAVLHNDINKQQVELIKSLERQVVVVPDQDKAGMKLVEVAQEQGWFVSIPDWPEDVKDVNDAVIKFGRLATLMMIMEAKETNKIKIEIRKKQIVKRL